MEVNFKIIIAIFFSTILQAQEYIGIIKPIHDVELSASVEGEIEKILVKEGDRVNHNDILLQIDNTLQVLEMQRRELIWRDASQLLFAKKNLKILKSLVQSNQNLYNKTKAVSHDELRALQIKYYTAQGDVQARIENEKKEKIEYQIAKNVLSQYTLLASVDGRITKITKQESEWVNRGEVLLRIVNTDACFLEVSVDEIYARDINLDKVITIKLMINNTLENIKGRVIFVSPIADKSSGLVRLKIKFDNTKREVRPGRSASIDLE